MQTARINGWKIVGNKIFGYVFDHPKFEDGTWVETSVIQKIVTKNTEYTLDAPDIEQLKPITEG